MSQGYGKKARREASSKIRSVPTSPLHAMLDELRIYRDYDLDYSLKRCGTPRVGKRSIDVREKPRVRMVRAKGKTDEEVESTDPANGHDERQRSQAKAFLQEWNMLNTDKNDKRQPKTGPNSRTGNIKPWPQNLQMRGSSLEPVIFWNQSRNFNLRMAGNSKGNPKVRRACWSLERHEL